jgi:hypothetical protein
MRELGKMKFDALVDPVSAADFMNPLGHRPVFGTAHRCGQQRHHHEKHRGGGYAKSIKEATSGDTFTRSNRNVQMAKAGINYRFNWGSHAVNQAQRPIPAVRVSSSDPEGVA